MEGIKRLFAWLKNKSNLSTVMAAYLGFSIETLIIKKYAHDPSFTTQELWTIITIFAICLVFYVLPRKFKANIGNSGMEMED